jgi:hypothetical protein
MSMSFFFFEAGVGVEGRGWYIYGVNNKATWWGKGESNIGK